MSASYSVSERLASWVVGLDYGDLPADVVAVAKRLVLDQFGLQLRGSTLPNVQPVRTVASALGGCGEATVTGGSMRVPAPQAAWSTARSAIAQNTTTPTCPPGTLPRR
jgi:2-methylcitrate dehydratase PrpD